MLLPASLSLFGRSLAVAILIGLAAGILPHTPGLKAHIHAIMALPILGTVAAHWIGVALSPDDVENKEFGRISAIFALFIGLFTSGLVYALTNHTGRML